jgi:hypothetical protein
MRLKKRALALALGNQSGSNESGASLTFDFWKGTVVDTFGGIVPTFVRATTKTQTDFEGKPSTALSGEVVFEGLRRVQNLLQGEDFSGVAFTTANATVTGGVTDPLGGATAYTLTATAGGGLIFRNSTLTAGLLAVGSVWIRRRTGVGVVNGIAGGTTNVPLPITAAWQRLSWSGTTLDTNFRWQINLATNGDAVDIWHAQSENATGQANQNPSEYVSVGVLATPFHGAKVDGVKYFNTLNGNTVVGNVITEATGASIPRRVGYDVRWPNGYYPEAASTNLVLQSENFGTTWAAINTPTRVAASDSCGFIKLDLLGDDDATALVGYSQTITYSGNAVKVVSVWVKKGTSTSSVVQLTDTTAVADRLLFAITWTGATPTATMTTGSLCEVREYANGVWRICTMTTSVTAANTNSLRIYPATNAALAVASTGTILIGGVQSENAIAKCSSYIPTTTASVTRNKDDMTVASLGGWYNALAGTLLAEYVCDAQATSSIGFCGFDDGTTNNRIHTYRSSTNSSEVVSDSAVVQANLGAAGATALPANGQGKIAHSWVANNVELYTNGSRVLSGDQSATIPTVTTMVIGQLQNGTTQFGGLLALVYYFPKNLSRPYLVQLTS